MQTTPRRNKTASQHFRRTTRPRQTAQPDLGMRRQILYTLEHVQTTKMRTLETQTHNRQERGYRLDICVRGKCGLEHRRRGDMFGRAMAVVHSQLLCLFLPDASPLVHPDDMSLSFAVTCVEHPCPLRPGSVNYPAPALSVQGLAEKRSMWRLI